MSVHGSGLSGGPKDQDMKEKISKALRIRAHMLYSSNISSRTSLDS